MQQYISLSCICVNITQLIRFARASNNYHDFLKRHLHLRNWLLDQGYKKIRFIRYLKKFIFRYQYLVDKNVKKMLLSMYDVKLLLTFT